MATAAARRETRSLAEIDADRAYVDAKWRDVERLGPVGAGIRDFLLSRVDPVRLARLHRMRT
jgi:hypothetical protein